jgi:hypothetical protein
MDEDEKIKVWKDEAAMNGHIIKDEVKVKDLKKLTKDLKKSAKDYYAPVSSSIPLAFKDYYAPGSSFIQDQEEYNKQKAHNKFLKDLDFVRYEEHAEEEYKKHLKKFFKGDKC